jgi:ribulose-phosphate 3-epimerase
VGKLAASILAADLAHLAAQVKLVEGNADLIHIDMMDAHFVPPLTIGPPVVASLRPHTALTLHAHLQVETPEGLFDDLAEAGTDVVTFQVEAVADPTPVIRKARGMGMRVGIALVPETPVESAMSHLDEVDDVIVLAVHPGWAGQPFQPEVLRKVHALRAEIDRRGLAVDLHVDGGVNGSTAPACVDAGATVLVVASAIFGAVDPAAAARDLKRVVEAT